MLTTFIERLRARGIVFDPNPAPPAPAPPANPPANPPAPTPPANPPAPPAPANPPAPPAPPHDPVPYDRFQEVNAAKAAAEQAAATAAAERDAARAQLQQQQRAGLSDLDRVRAELADAQAQIGTLQTTHQQAEQRAVQLEREGWVRTAAQQANFHDPADAIARVDLSQITTQEAAQREVGAIASRAGHLVRPATATQAQQLQSILSGGNPVVPQAGAQPTDAKPVIPTDTFNAMTADQLVALQETDPELYQRSLAAASQS